MFWAPSVASTLSVSRSAGLARRMAALSPDAVGLRAALLRGESPESLGLTEDGLAALIEGSGITK